MMLEVRRGKPYVWVTSIAKLLSGDRVCAFEAWMKAHYVLPKKPDTSGRLAAYKIAHASLMRKWAAEHPADDVDLYIERGISCRGHVGILAGKIDRLDVTPSAIGVTDFKTGQYRDSDFAQVLTYLWMLPRAEPELVKDRALIGGLEYGDGHAMVVPPDPTIGVEIGRLMQIICADDPPRPLPGVNECRFCDLTREQCSARVDAPETDPETVTVDAF